MGAMSTTASKSLRYNLAFVLIFLIALLLRFSQLDAVPLDDAEATEALAALGLADNNSGVQAYNPAYAALTSAAFRLFGANDWLARFWPALAGSLLTLIPFFLRETWGPSRALMFGAGFAILPPFVATSRFAGADGLALLAFGLAFLALGKGNWNWLAIALALGLLAGPGFYLGLLSLILALALILIGFRRSAAAQWLDKQWAQLIGSLDRRHFGISLAITLLLLSTVLLTRLNGIGLIGNGLAAFVQGWTVGGGLPLGQMLLSALLYFVPLATLGLLAVPGVIRQRNPLGQVLIAWQIATALLLLLYPGRRAEDLAWLMLPALGLAALLLDRWLEVPKDYRVQVGATVFLLVVLLLFQWFNFASLANFEVGSEPFVARSWVAIGVPVVAVIALTLVAGGWARDIPLHALAITTAMLLAFLGISQSARIAKPNASAANLLWRGAQAAGQAHLLDQSLFLLSDLNYGRNDELSLDMRFDSPSLAWQLRDWPGLAATFSGAPDAIISSDQATRPGEDVAYRGQDFVWSRSTAWPDPWPPNLFAWGLFQEAPLTNHNIVLWVREDLFPPTMEDLATSDEDQVQ